MKKLNISLIFGATTVICVLIGIWIGKNINTNEEKPHVDKTQSEVPVEQSHDEVIRFDPTQIKQAGITISQANPTLIGSITQLSGEIRANEDRTAHVVPQLSGFVQSVSGDMGQLVKQGQVLAIITSPQLSELRSDLLAAQKRKELAQITYEREKKLWEEKISSEQDYLQARQHLSEINIAYDNAKQKLSALGAGTSTSLNRYELRAPFDGMIVEKHITQGEAVKEDANVFTISDLSTVWAEVIVSAQDLKGVRVGEKALVRATSMESVAEGKVTFVSSLFGEQTRTAKARITLKNPQMAWRPGLFVNVDLTNDERKVAVAVKSEAIQTIDSQPTVFVKVDGGFIPKKVQTGHSDGQYIEITQGLEAGASYAASGSFVIKAEQGKGAASHGH